LQILHLEDQYVPTSIPKSVRHLSYNGIKVKKSQRTYEPLTVGCEHVETLQFQGYRISLLPLSRFSNLRSLSIMSHTTTKLFTEEYEFEAYRRATRLVGKECARIITEFVACSLQELTLRYCSASTLSPLAKFQGLTHLNMFYSCNISNLDGLFGLPLKTLILHGCANLVSIGALRDSFDLEFLDLADCRRLADVSALFALPKLKAVWLKNVPIPSLQMFELQNRKTKVYRGFEDDDPDAYRCAFGHLLIHT
jgi:hypothetical protein